MDNEAPNYAQWINEAGGYVANGNVVSRSPIYEENGSGRMKIKVDVSEFGNTQPQNSTVSSQPQVANTAAGNVGVQTANIVGSGTDANAAATKIGSMTTLENNLGKAQDSAISSPATKSIVAGKTILTPEDEVNREYQDAVARGNFQGQINALTKASRLTGNDYSAEIQDLNRQRQQKIQDMDDRYLQAINEAKYQGDLTGDYTNYNNLLRGQNDWRNSVGYRDAMRDKYQADIDAIDIDYQNTYMQSINDIGNQLVQALPGILNFQYNPNTDLNLQIAQGYAVSRVKEQMNSTGMYYSSMTQNAITKAVGELVPVYAKMAREEAVENFKLLQQTASFLMDLEQTQFNMWKSQIQLKFDANAEKRAQVDQAIQNANARGYYTNEEAALLGVEPGTPSYESRTRALDKQEQIEKEQRNLQQSMALAEFNASLGVQEYAEKQRIAAQYEIQTYKQKLQIQNAYGGSGSGSNGSGVTYSQALPIIQGAARNGASVEELQQLGGSLGLSGAETNAAILSAAFNEQADQEKKAKEEQEKAEKKAKERGKLTNIPLVAVDIADDNLAERYNDFMKTSSRSEAETKNFLKTLSNASEKDRNLVIGDWIGTKNSAIDDITKKAFNSGDYGTTKAALDKAINNILTVSSEMADAGLDNKVVGTYTEKMMTNLIDNINSSTKFDFSWMNFNDDATRDQMKDEAAKYVVDKLGQSDNEVLATITTDFLESYSRSNANVTPTLFDDKTVRNFLDSIDIDQAQQMLNTSRPKLTISGTGAGTNAALKTNNK